MLRRRPRRHHRLRRQAGSAATVCLFLNALGRGVPCGPPGPYTDRCRGEARLALVPRAPPGPGKTHAVGARGVID